MKRDIIGDIFLGGVLLSLLFIFSFPVYFEWNGVVARPIELNERLMGVCYLMAWILVAVWACWKKKVWVVVGAASFGLLAYLPKWFLPMVDEKILKEGSSMVDSFLSMLLNRIYELIHAPFVGTVGLLGEDTAKKLPEVLFPAIVIAYILVQIIRYYRNAYITEKKQMHDWAHFRKNTEARMATAAAAAAAAEQPSAPLPLGTVVLNEKAEVAEATFPGREVAPSAVDDKTAVANLNDPGTIRRVSADTMKVPPIPAPSDTIRLGDGDTKAVELPARASTSVREDDGDTKAIELPARAPTSAQAEDGDTKAIELPAHAPTSAPVEDGDTKAIELPAHAPTSVPADDDATKPIILAAHAPTSKDMTEPAPAETPKAETPTTPPEDVLDFPDVRGEAEKIDVFGDDDLD